MEERERREEREIEGERERREKGRVGWAGGGITLTGYRRHASILSPGGD